MNEKQTAVTKRHERYLAISKHAMGLESVTRQLAKPNSSQVYLRCQGKAVTGAWHRSGWSLAPSLNKTGIVDLTLWADHDTDHRLEVSKTVTGAEKGGTISWTCETCNRAHTQSQEVLLTAVVLAYDTPIREGTFYVARVR